MNRIFMATLWLYLKTLSVTRATLRWTEEHLHISQITVERVLGITVVIVHIYATSAYAHTFISNFLDWYLYGTIFWQHRASDQKRMQYVTSLLGVFVTVIIVTASVFEALVSFLLWYVRGRHPELFDFWGLFFAVYYCVTMIPRNDDAGKRRKKKISESVREWLSTLSWLPQPEGA